MNFTEMKLADYIVQGLASQGIENATEIQELTLPLIKSGVDVIGLSQTGSGKTYAFGIPVLERMDKECNDVQFLIVCPTRELAAQVAEDLRKLTNLTSRISIAPIFGGSNMDRQITTLKRGAKIVIGTPGRLMDHLRRKTLKLDNLKMVILDEADEMLNMGFKEDIETILKTTPNTRQTVMFSATMPPEIIRITKQYMKEPVLIKSKNQNSAPVLIKQCYVNCNKTEKTDILMRIYEKLNPWISIVFCNTKRMTEELSLILKKKGLPVVCLHGDMRQNERKRTMEKFKKEAGGGILVATDVAARGIDVKNVDIVINYDFPNNEDYYVHRIGRTGRAGKEGLALTIINTKNQSKNLQTLTNKIGAKLEEYEDFSTTQFLLTRESSRNESRRRTDNQKAQRQNRVFNNERPNRTDNKRRNDFSSNRNNFKRSVITKLNNNNPKDIEVFEIGGSAPHFGKTNSKNKRFSGSFQKRFEGNQSNKRNDRLSTTSKSRDPRPNNNRQNNARPKSKKR